MRWPFHRSLPLQLPLLRDVFRLPFSLACLLFWRSLCCALNPWPLIFHYCLLSYPFQNCGRVVGNIRLVGGNQFLNLKMQITLETIVGKEYDHFVERQGAPDVGIGASSLYRILGLFRD